MKHEEILAVLSSVLVITMKHTYRRGTLNANKFGETRPKMFCPLSIRKTQALNNMWIVYELASPFVSISVHGGCCKADARNNVVRKNVVLGLNQHWESQNTIWLTFCKDRARTQSMSYNATTVAVDGRREKKCLRSTTLYFCCSPGVSMFAKKWGMSWQQISTMMPVSSKQSIAAFCLLPSAASYNASHWSMALSGTVTCHCLGARLRARSIQHPTMSTWALEMKYMGL